MILIMNFKDIYKREIHAVVHGQSVKFRIGKYIVLFAVFSVFYAWRGITDTLLLLAILFIVSLCIHFFFRWQSKGWTQSWGLYKHTPLGGE